MKNNMKKFRKSLNMTQDELSKQCNVTRQTINAIENNKYDPTLSLAFNLARNLRTTVDELFIFEDKER
ncbi:helix-turn-helix transcriptional regulator [Sediminibacillus massiliensis]|uniref:helix-turn-helix transcriptional regulator n=1 Tax=Sediminibacillus massiliensis TaxID=1926277 RepID=UPI000988853F|nr:helix-turn-helix transcriptional regulator [Sediminibacillus massiliensis]